MKWEPIETAPLDGREVLLLIPDEDKRVITQGHFAKGLAMGRWEVVTLPEHGCDCCAYYNEEPTHWMPLPSLPDEED